MRKPGAQQEKGECASSTFASGGSFSLDYCRCYYSFHLLLRVTKPATKVSPLQRQHRA